MCNRIIGWRTLQEWILVWVRFCLKEYLCRSVCTRNPAFYPYLRCFFCPPKKESVDSTRFPVFAGSTPMVFGHQVHPTCPRFHPGSRRDYGLGPLEKFVRKYTAWFQITGDRIALCFLAAGDDWRVKAPPEHGDSKNMWIQKLQHGRFCYSKGRTPLGLRCELNMCL